jgi:hypothetical protein
MATSVVIFGHIFTTKFLFILFINHPRLQERALSQSTQDHTTQNCSDHCPHDLLCSVDVTANCFSHTASSLMITFLSEVLFQPVTGEEVARIPVVYFFRHSRMNLEMRTQRGGSGSASVLLVC